jgi:ATP-dependent Lon protease
MNNDVDIKNWLAHINKSTSRKRKRDDNDDTMLNELTYNSIESIIEILTENEITTTELNDMLDNLEIIFSGTKQVFNNDPKIRNNKDTYLLLCACISISLDIITRLKEEKNKTKRFNAVAFLNKYKKEFYVPEPKRKLGKIKIKLDSNNDISPDEMTTEDEDYEPEGEGEGDGEDGDECEYSEEHGSTSTFINELKKISNNIGSSKEEMITYFNNMEKKDQTDTIKSLNEISHVNYDNIPYIFRIIQSPLNTITKKNIISKILQAHSVMDSGKAKRWVDDVMKLPFGIYKGLDLDTMKGKPAQAKKFLDSLDKNMNDAVYGHNDAKKQIVRIMGQMIRNPSCKGNVIGLYGPPGCGKTSLIQEGIAKAMEKPFVFISLGGATDSSFLDGHSYTYEGSIYGRIAQALIDAKCMNPIIYFDELDKVSRCHKGDEIINMLIHLVDPAQNQLFRDKYFYNVDIDLSKVTFIFSFNDPSEVNYILRDRITMIETKYLTNAMKLHIGMNYLLPEILKDVGIKNDDIIISEDIMTDIINSYTDEGGVRKLKKQLYRIVRELNHLSLTDKKINFPIILTMDKYNEIFKGIIKVNHMTVHKEDGVGMVNGMWANSMGCGGVLPIESVLIPGKEKMEYKATGMLGKVIKESIEVALSVAWNILTDEMKDIWMDRWKTKPECFHLHCPDGSTDKDGPSAGAAMTLAFYSRLTNKMVRHNVAMTGEINLRGEVTAIGGLDEKLNAAKRAGAVLALIPRENAVNLDNVVKNNPTLIDSDFRVELVDTIYDVIKFALC